MSATMLGLLLLCLALVAWLNVRLLIMIPIFSVAHMLPEILNAPGLQPDMTAAAIVGAAAIGMSAFGAAGMVAAIKYRYTATIWLLRAAVVFAALLFLLVMVAPPHRAMGWPGGVGLLAASAGVWIFIASAKNISYSAKIYRQQIQGRQVRNLKSPSDGQERAPAPVVRQPEAAQNAQAEVRDAVPVQKPRYTLADVAGMAEMKQQLKPFLKAFETAGKHAPVAAPDRNGLLLSGPPGNGKTFLAEAIAGELNLPIMFVTTDAIRSQWLGKASEKIGEIVAQAIRRAPVVLFLDEIDAVGGKRDAGNQHEESAIIVNTLLQAINELRKHRIVLIGATNRYEHLDPALIRDGRFDFRVDIPNPDLEARTAIIAGLASKFNVVLSKSDVSALASFWVERSASFLEGAFKRARDDAKETRAPITVDVLKQAGRLATRRETAIPKDCEQLEEMFFAPAAREAIEGVVYAMKNWDKIEAKGGKVPKGVLLYGPPGTGKTAVTRAIARSMGDVHVFEVRTAEVLADPRKFNDVMELARAHRPAIVFLDEADELLRDRTYSASATATNEILKAMDGMMSKVPEVYFFAATNNVDALDSAAVRGGRFSERILLDALAGEDLVSYIRQALNRRKMMHLATDVTPEAIASMLERAGPANVNEVLGRCVAYSMARGDDAVVTLRDIARAVDTVMAHQ